VTTVPTAPVVAVHQVRGDHGGMVWLLIVQCPHCLRTHTHGGGTDRTRVAEYLGHRVAHCPRHDHGGYFLADPDDLLHRVVTAGETLTSGRVDDSRWTA